MNQLFRSRSLINQIFRLPTRSFHLSSARSINWADIDEYTNKVNTSVYVTNDVYEKDGNFTWMSSSSCPLHLLLQMNGSNMNLVVMNVWESNVNNFWWVRRNEKPWANPLVHQRPLKLLNLSRTWTTIPMMIGQNRSMILISQDHKNVFSVRRIWRLTFEIPNYWVNSFLLKQD